MGYPCVDVLQMLFDRCWVLPGFLTHPFLDVAAFGWKDCSNLEPEHGDDCAEYVELFVMQRWQHSIMERFTRLAVASPLPPATLLHLPLEKVDLLYYGVHLRPDDSLQLSIDRNL